jgi:hypothetical protein
MIDLDISEAKSPEQKEEILRKIWGIDFVDRVIFNSCKIASIESHFLRLRDSCPDSITYKKALDRLMNFRRAYLISGLYDSTLDIHDETNVPYSEFKKRFPILPPILTSQYIERELHETYYPSSKRHLADRASTLEEKAQSLIQILGESRFDELTQQTFEETCQDAEREGLKQKYSNEVDYTKELTQRASLNHSRMILRLHKLIRYFHYITQQPCEKIPELLKSNALKYDRLKFGDVMRRLKLVEARKKKEAK